MKSNKMFEFPKIKQSHFPHNKNSIFNLELKGFSRFKNRSIQDPQK